MKKTRSLVSGFILLLFVSILLKDAPPGPAFRQWMAAPFIFLLRTTAFFFNDLFQFSRISVLVEENRELKRKLTLSQKEKFLLQEKVRSFQRQETLLLFQKAHPETKGFFCHIIGRSPSHWSQTILLDRGSRDGIETDMAVLGTKGLVGRIVEVHPNWSKALLITDSDAKVGAILERSRETGLLVGSARGLLTLEYLSPGADLREGDRVLTAGFGEIFPKGILIGEVVGFGRREEDLFMYALVRPIEQHSQLEEVLCIKR